jgi:NitT/TauT family transport system substrate-binding protein
MVYEMYNRGPSVLVTRADGPIKTLKDIEGRSVGAPAGSASARLLPLLARPNGPAGGNPIRGAVARDGVVCQEET